MKLYEMIELGTCPVCGGDGLLEEEPDTGFYVTCVDCGSHSVITNYKSEDDKEAAARNTARLWNEGRVISSARGE